MGRPRESAQSGDPQRFTVGPLTLGAMPVRYKKLRGGSWGLSITGQEADGIEVGNRLEVLIRQRNGTENVRTVSVFWKGKNLYEEGDVALAAFVKAEETPPRKHPQATAADERRMVEDEMRSRLLTDQKTLAEYVADQESDPVLYDFTLITGDREQ